MAIIKCKMCGGDIELSADKTFGTCEYCGSVMTLPKVDDDQRAAAFNRGNHFRRIGEFDKALAVYERIVAEDNTDAEAHWCCALCRFGIEYVEDPTTYEWLPTCHRASFDSILEDVDYLAAVEYSDGITRRQYQKDAAKIAEVQRGILATSQREEPFDVFICYKESDENGNRTVDSTLAQDIYYQLADKDYRVFFSRITLEDKVGAEYEPYIFAALNSAKVMIVVGTKPEHFNAVWVKNEWSRFLALMRKDRSKLLLPCYRDVDPYDLPEQLSVLQSYDMAKIGFIQDLIRGVSKVLDADKEQPAVKETVIVQSESSSSLIALLKRGQMALEDGEWSRADEFFERVLDQDAECAEAYLGKAMAESQIKNIEAFRESYVRGNVGETNNLRRAKQYANADQKSRWSTLDKKRKAWGEEEKKRRREEEIKRQEEEEKIKKAEAERREQMRPQYAEIRNRIKRVQDYISAGGPRTVGLRPDGTVIAVGSNQNGQSDVSDWKDIMAVSAGWHYTVGLRSDGTVVAVGKNEDGQCNVNDWKDIVAISAGFHTVGLRSDGTVVAVGKNNSGQCDISKWTDIVAISAGSHTVGLRSDGTVVAVGWNNYGQCDVSNWTDIVALSASSSHTVGLRSDGTVVAVGKNFHGQCNVSNWTDIVAVSAGSDHTVGLRADGTVVAVGSYRGIVSQWKLFNNYQTLEQEKAEAAEQRAQMKQQYAEIRKRIKEVQGFISAGDSHTVGLRSDGTVVVVGGNSLGQCDVSGWKDIVAVSAYHTHTVGLQADGTVVAVGYSRDGKCDVSDWKDIMAISAGYNHTVGLRQDGTVVAVGTNEDGQCNVNDWKDIVAISAGSYHTVGLHADGTVVAVVAKGMNGKYPHDKGQSNVGDWTDIVAVSAGSYHTVGLRSDGTVVAVGWSYYGECDVSNWTDIVAVSAGDSHTVGLRADGTVVAVGKNEYGQCDVSGWKDIVAVSAGASHTVGLRADGTVVAVGHNSDGRCEVSQWKLFEHYQTVDRERAEAYNKIMIQSLERKQKQEEMRLSAFREKRNTAQTELANLRGLFTGKRRKQLETEIASLNQQISSIEKNLEQTKKELSALNSEGLYE